MMKTAIVRSIPPLHHWLSMLDIAARRGLNVVSSVLFSVQHASHCIVLLLCALPRLYYVYLQCRKSEVIKKD